MVIRSPRRRCVALVAGLALVPSVAACGGSDGDGDGGAERGAEARAAPARLLDPAAFERVVARPGVVTVNVHVPYEGEIPGTDRSIRYDRISEGTPGLPPRSTRIALLCMSGRMSADAAQRLARLGYDDVVDLRGGMEAWRRSGRPIVHRPASSPSRR